MLVSLMIDNNLSCSFRTVGDYPNSHWVENTMDMLPRYHMADNNQAARRYNALAIILNYHCIPLRWDEGRI